ncbi:MAG: CoA transferase [Burkholderiaceae bacterium]|nr:CoA transferase [Burkholderiaceae bacterium]
MTNPHPILGGLRVVELTAFIAAPSAGLTLAQLGADVIRVDPVGGNIDISRLPLAANGRSLYWASLNRGKRSVEIDARNPQGERLLAELICAPGEGGGIFITNLPVRGELAYEALARRRNDLIMVMLGGSPDGATAVDYTVNCAVGFPLLTGDGTRPVNHVLPAWDVIAGQMIVTAVLAAERQRRASGTGQLVRLALSDVAMAVTANLGYLAEVEINRSERAADGNFVYGAWGDSFSTSDARHLMVVAISDRQWRALLRATGLGDGLNAAAKASGHRLDNEAGRYAARELISGFLRPWFAARSLDEVQRAFSDSGVLWGPYRSAAQMLAEDPRCSPANPMFAQVEHPGLGRTLTAATPIDFGAAARMPPGVATTLGAHTDEVLEEILGADSQRLAALRAAGTIGGSQC